MEAALAVTQAKYWHLKQVDLFEGLADWELKQLVNIADLGLFKRGQDVFRAGDISDRFFLIRTGKVKLFRELPDGKEVILGFEGPGSMFGEASVTGESTRSEAAQVVEDAFLCTIDRDRFAGYLDQHPEIALRITSVIAQRKQRADERVIALLSEDVRTRLAHALAGLAEQYGEDDDEGLRIGLRLTQTDLGQLVGSTRETTSMAFNAFRRDGLVDSKDRVIWVKNVEALRAI